MTIAEKINIEYPHMTKSEKTLSAFLLSHREDFERASISDLAFQNKVSTTTIIRFARRLGYDGFKDFKRALCSDSVVFPTLVNKFDTIVSVSGNHVLSDTLRRAIGCLEKTFADLPAESFTRALLLLRNARRVCSFGMKESYALAHYAFTRFYTVRENTFLLNLSGGDIEPLLDLSSEDVCMVFLFHRYTQRALDFLSLIKKQGVSVILVTNTPCDAVSAYADILLPCVVDDVGIKNSSIAPVCLLDCLCNALAADNSSASLERFRKIEALLDSPAVLGD